MNAPTSGLVPCPNHPEVTAGLGACGLCGRHFCGDCLVRLGGVPTCAGCKLERLSDLRSGAGELDFAGSWRRFCAVGLDSLLFFTPGLALAFNGLAYDFGPHYGPQPPPGVLERLGFHAQRGVWLPVVCAALLMLSAVVYQALMLSARGQTLGKMALSVKVVTRQGGNIRPGQAWARVLSDLVMGGFFYPLGLIDALLIFSRRRRTLHDRLAGTVVVNWRR